MEHDLKETLYWSGAQEISRTQKPTLNKIAFKIGNVRTKNFCAAARLEEPSYKLTEIRCAQLELKDCPLPLRSLLDFILDKPSCK
ncbi:hypothetical protein SUGI_1170690 [Cryptomeria japonica]|nr:hypothetical protein SUGI_1170690 [Cryptomeria japonica]